MAITSYATLVDAIVDRMNNADLSSYAPEFIQMAEAMFNRRLSNLEMEGQSTASAAASMALPYDYKLIRSVHLNDHGPLGQLSPDDFQKKWADDSAGQPVDYAIMSGELRLGPQPDASYTVTLTYVRKLVGLSAINTTNWLLEDNPDLYLYASLLHAEFRGWNDERLPMIKSLSDEIISEINIADALQRRGDLISTVEGVYF